MLDAIEQGLAPDYTIADAAKGLRAGQEAAFGETPSLGDIFHIQHQCEGLVNGLSRQAKGATSRRQELEQQMDKAKQKGLGNTLSTKLTLARQAEKQAIQLAADIKTLTHWLSHDILSLAGPPWSERQELFDFIVAEFRRREAQGGKRIRSVRTALENQRSGPPRICQGAGRQTR